MEQNTIPDGYWEDARGCLIPVEQIKEIDKARDELVREKVAKAKAMQTQLRREAGRRQGQHHLADL